PPPPPRPPPLTRRGARLEGGSAAGRDRGDASQQLLARRPWWRRRTRRERSEDALDPFVQGGVLVEDGRAVEETDAPDSASQDGVIVRCGGQGANEREERIGAVAAA